tara:strand:+ start:25 stop:348 length:324 start_codon:yes stop_codon:yes gene_type:complete
VPSSLCAAKVIAIRNSYLELHGKPKLTYTKLGASAYYGNTTIFVEDKVDWEVGDEIIIGSTSYSQLETEERVVEAVSEDADAATGLYSISINAPLDYDHHGGEWTSN